MSVPNTNLDLEEKSLSLIDFCSEDDCLYASPPRDHPSLRIPDDQKKQKSVQFLGVQDAEDSCGGDEQVIQLFESSGQKKTKKNEKYNLRKSLAWDNAFFTSAGFLDPEELSTMISGVEQGEKRFALPGIEEEICRSSESICTLATDKSMSGAPEDDLFGDIRASIQKSSIACKENRKAEKREEKLALTGIEEDMRRSNDSVSTLATGSPTLGTLEDDVFGDIRTSIQNSSKASRTVSQSKPASGLNASQLVKSSQKVGSISQNKLLTKAALKKPSVVLKGSGKMVNKVSPSPEASKCGSRTGESASSLSKPPKILARASSLSAIPTKRASLSATSLSANCIKVEKNNGKTLTGRGTKVPAISASRCGVPKPLPSVKSSLHSSGAIKTQLSPSSSIDSFRSLSSNSSSKHSPEIEKRKIDSKSAKYSSTSSTVRSTIGSTTKTAPTNRNQSMNSRILPRMKSLTKPSSSISPASSISEWSSASFSPTSTLNNRSSISRPSFDTSSCTSASNKVDAFQASDAENHSSNGNCSVGNSTRVTGLVNKSAKRVSTGSGAVNHPEGAKPSGLRLPSPKIGFFDGTKSTVRTPTGSLKSPSVPCNLPRPRSGNFSPSRGLNESRPEKLQPARPAMPIRGPKAGVQKTALETKPRSPLPLQETSNLSPKIFSVSKAGKSHPIMPLKVQNKKSPEKDELYNLNAENIATKESKTASSNPDFCDSQRSNSPCKDKITPHGQGSGFENVEEVPIFSGGSSATCNSNSTLVEEGEFCSQKNDFGPAAEIKTQSPLPLQEASNLSPKVFSGSKTGKHSPGMPLEVQNKKSAEKYEQSNLKAENIATKECNTTMSNPDFCGSEGSNSLCQDNVSSYIEGNDSGKVEDVPTVDGGSTATTCNSSEKKDLKPASEIQPKSPFPLQEASNFSPKFSSGSKTGKHSPGMPLEVLNKMSPGKDKQYNLIAENISVKESNNAISNLDFCGSERRNTLCGGKLSSYGEGKDPEKVADTPTIDGGSSTTCTSSSTVVKDDECHSQNDSLEIQPKSPFPLREASNLSPKVFSASKTGKHSPRMPVEVQNKKSPGKDEQVNLNIAENITAMSNPDFCGSDRRNSLCKDKISSCGEGNDPEKVADFSSVGGGSSATCNSSSTMEQEASNLSPKVFSASKTGKHSPRMPVEVQNKKSPGKDEQVNLNIAENITAMSNPDFCGSDRRNSLCKDKISSCGEGNDPEKVADFPSVGGGSSACNSSSTMEQEGEFCKQKKDLKPPSEIQPNFPFPLHEPSNLSLKVFSGSKTGKQSPVMPVEIQNKKSPGQDERCNLNAENSLCKDRMGSNGAGNDCGQADTIAIDGESSATCNSSSTSVQEGEFCSQKNDSDYVSSSVKKQNVSVDGLARQVGPFDIHGEIQQRPADNRSSLYQVNISIEVNPGVQAETVNLSLSMPAPSQIPIEGAKVVDADER